VQLFRVLASESSFGVEWKSWRPARRSLHGGDHVGEALVCLARGHAADDFIVCGCHNAPATGQFAHLAGDDRTCEALRAVVDDEWASVAEHDEAMLWSRIGEIKHRP
jgi:hypothetical protein